MGSIAVDEYALNRKVEVADLKPQVLVRQLEEEEAKPPVADNFMYDFKYNHSLPTPDVLGIEIPANCDAPKEAEGIVARLSEALGAGDAQAFTDLFLDYGVFSTYFRYNCSWILTLSLQVCGATSWPSRGTTVPSTSSRPS
jgi:hypothetical protein